MKRSILMLLVMSAALIFFGCEKMEEVYPESEVAEEEKAAFKGAKVEDVVTSFTGTCVAVANPHPPNIPATLTPLGDGRVLSTGEVGEWYDEATDPRVTGRSIWHVTRLIEADGLTQYCTCKTILIVKGGKWEFETEGDIIPILNAKGIPIGLEAEFEADGVGTHGQVKGLTAHWTYSIEYYFDDPTTFLYYTEGTIEGKRVHGKY